MGKVTVSDIQEKFQLEVLAGHEGLSNEIVSEDIHRPGLEMTGFFTYFPNDRIQVIGRQEFSYFQSLPKENKVSVLNEYIKLPFPCIVITRSQEPQAYLIELCNENNIPLLRTYDKTTNFISEVNNFLEKQLAPETNVHGVLVNVFGVGTLIRGKSGIGKSEIALALIERGHRLIADDSVILKKIGPVALIGTHNGLNKHFLSLRGIGLVNVLRLYGSGSYQSETKINLDIELEPWEENKYYDAIGLEEKKIDYFGIEVPHISLPIRPGRDIASLIEVAAKNWRLHSQGYNALAEFQERFHEKND